jgi:hypothetical protein
MDDDVRTFGTELGRTVIARDRPGVHAMLAPWMRAKCSVDDMRTLGFDCFCEVWAAVVNTAEGLRIGYWSQGAY